MSHPAPATDLSSLLDGIYDPEGTKPLSEPHRLMAHSLPALKRAGELRNIVVELDENQVAPKVLHILLRSLTALGVPTEDLGERSRARAASFGMSQEDIDMFFEGY